MRRRGFVLIELIVVLAIVGSLIGLAVMNVTGPRSKAVLTGAIDTLVADITSQQTKAMSGTVEAGVLQPGYGIRFETDRYVLFRGIKYNPADSSNAVILLDSHVTFNQISLPDNSVIFASSSGEIIGYVPTSNSVTVKQLDTGETKTVLFNHYGVITSMQ